MLYVSKGLLSLSEAHVVRRIHISTVIRNTKVQMRALRQTGCANITNALSRTDKLTGFYNIIIKMHVHAGETVIVVDDHVIARLVSFRRGGHGTGPGGIHRGSQRCCQVNTIVRPDITQNRMGTV